MFCIAIPKNLTEAGPGEEVDDGDGQALLIAVWSHHRS